MKYCKNGEVRFNLVVKGNSKLAQIWLIFNFDGNRLRYYIGKRISLINWDPTKQRVKTQVVGAFKINELIGKLARILEDSYTDAKILGKSLTVADLQKKLKGYDNVLPQHNFNDEFEKFIQNNKNSKSISTIKQYQNVLNHLKEFSSKRNFSLTFDSITGEFFNTFVKYLQNDVGQFNNTVHKIIKTLKVFLNHVTENGINTNTSYPKIHDT